jgi:hypothetical protein
MADHNAGGGGVCGDVGACVMSNLFCVLLLPHEGFGEIRVSEGVRLIREPEQLLKYTCLCVCVCVCVFLSVRVFL